MNKRRVWRYKCDFCKKANCSSYHIAKHERGCTNNPNRICGMCSFVRRANELNGEPYHPPLPLAEAIKLLPIRADDDSRIEILLQGNGDDTEAARILEAVRKAVSYCPACTLAVLRQSPLESVGSYLTFDYKSAVKAFWSDYDNDAG